MLGNNEALQMNHDLTIAIRHWEHVAPIVKYPANEKEFNKLVSQLDELLDLVGGQENHKLIGLISTISTLISAYEQEHHPAPKITGVAALKLLMEQHSLRQADLSEIGSQGVVSEILQGKRELNLRQIKLLAKRFHVDMNTFIDD